MLPIHILVPHIQGNLHVANAHNSYAKCHRSAIKYVELDTRQNNLTIVVDFLQTTKQIIMLNTYLRHAQCTNDKITMDKYVSIGFRTLW